MSSLQPPAVAPVRDRVDACPGALQTHSAADGELARVRVPGGVLTAAQLRVLAAAARELGDGHLELTSRGNLQLRGLQPGTQDQLGARLADAGLLPSDTHERARNVLASTLSGRDGEGHADAGRWVTLFDAGLRADPSLAELPGRFLATFDDGRGDVAGFAGDVGLLALSPDRVALLVGGTDTGLRATGDDAVLLALAAARAFLAERAAQGSTAWRVTELTDGPARVAARLDGPRETPVDVPPAPVVGPVGAATQVDGRTALIGVLPLGRLTAAQAELLADRTGQVQLTPWRSVVVPDLAEDTVDDTAVDLFRTGMVFDEASPWLRVTTCAGRGCARSLADVRADAVAAVRARALPADGARQHWVGCERRCGRPQGDVVDVVATTSGYRIEEG
ncbi:precorrin-3B synthase [Modestobacter sp. VKM Ac-2986]|uniref:precorrin-3B synthase n=1 Tax=Modestobacter sp. VKM Ac-2986 TaxID=3004140 RepID=UPI0022AB5CBE|nr:precorrin-3B synthase [Modestobacter sp. VKM Ac-2986]MCZ2830008.1 precorrin-3B synthase [Modestobacter sp. VKM Ac-2986]